MSNCLSAFYKRAPLAQHFVEISGAKSATMQPSSPLWWKRPCLMLGALLAFVALTPRVQAQTGNFTIIALPDTQYYSENFPTTFTAQTQWIVSNAAALNVQMVLGLGDVVQTATNVTEYQNADASVKLLDSAHIPYLLAVGNRDYGDGTSASGRTSALTNFNTYFGPSRYQGYSWYRGQYPAGSNENFYGVLTINGKTYLFLMLELFPRDSALAWANSVLAAYPNAEVIVVTHADVYIDGTLVSLCDQANAQAYNVGFDNNGDGLWNKFIKQHSNISLVLNGHFTYSDSTGEAVANRTDLGVSGNIVNQMLSDYQEMPNGGNGYLRVLTFNPTQNTISVSTYSPTLNASLTDPNNQFTVQWHSTGANPTGTGTIAGRVKDASTCSAISGAQVSTAGTSTSTDPSGSFSLTVPTPNAYSLTAQATGYPSVAQSINAWSGYPAFSKLFLSTQGPGTISGKITDQFGSPIANATVWYSGGTTTSDTNGNYSLASVPAGTYTVTASAAGYETSSTQNVAVSSGTTANASFTLMPMAGSISGIVTNSSGSPIPGATVSYSGGSTTTASNGTYTIPNVLVGTYGVTASAAGYQDSTQSNVNVSDDSTTTVNFTLSAGVSQTYSITGTITPSSIGSGSSVALSGPAPLLVQSAHGASASGSTSMTVSFSTASGAADTIVLFTRFGGTTISSITDTQTGGSNTYTPVLGPNPTQWGVTPNPTDREAQVFVAKNIPGGSKLTITINFAGPSTHTNYVAAVEYSGADPVNPVNAAVVATGTVNANGPPATGNLVTTVANAKLVATSWDSNESYTSTGNGTGYTTNAAAGIPSISGGAGWPNLTEDATAATPGSWKATASSSPSVDDWAIQLVALAPAPSQTVTADTSGNYTFTNVSNGTYTITPSKANSTFTPASQSPTVNGSNVTGVNFTVTGFTGTISGTVTNSSGTAIAGATVSYSAGSTTTASNGTYTLSSVPVGSVSVTATASGYQSSTQPVNVTSNTTTTQNFTLSAAVGTISGTVTNSSGTAISGATVSYTGGSTTTAANGAYTLPNVPVGNISVTASATGFQNSTQSANVTAGTTTTLNFTLSTPVGTITGTVTNSTGTAISGATVSYSGGSTTTAANGTYTLTNVPVGNVSVTASATGFQNSTQSATVTASTTTTLNFTLSTAVGTITGTVTNSSGTAISGATVSYSGGSTTTAANGTYTLPNVPVGNVSVTASATGFQNSTQSANVTAGTTTTLNFTLAAAVGTITGTVKNSAGTAISGATVSYTGGSTTTAANGTYTLPNVPVGNVSVTASATGFQNSTQSATVTANTTTTVNFILSATVGTITGTVTNASGTAISGATVSYSGGSTTTAANGTYTLPNVPVGNVSVTASATGFQSSTQGATVTANTTTTLNFTLAAVVTTGTITGTVTNSSGTAISGATVSYSGGSTTTAANGTYTLLNVPVGIISVTASATGFQSSTQSATVTASTTTTLNFSLASSVGQTFSIQGTITPASTGTGSLVALNGPVPVLVQTAKGSSSTGNNSVTSTFGAASAAGHAIVVFVRFGGTSTTISSITDTQAGGSNTYTSVIAATKWGTGSVTDRLAQAFVAKNITGGTKLTITVHFSAASTHDIYLVALEYSGVDPVNPVNATAVGKGSVSSNGAPTTANLTTTIGNTKLVATGWDANESYTSTSNGSGYTTNSSAGIASISGGSGWSNLTEDRTAATAGTWNATTTKTRAVTDWAVQVVALAPVSLQSATADASGNYTFSNLNNGSYTVTPSNSGHTFTPSSQSVTVNSANVTGVNFTAN